MKGVLSAILPPLAVHLIRWRRRVRLHRVMAVLRPYSMYAGAELLWKSLHTRVFEGHRLELSCCTQFSHCWIDVFSNVVGQLPTRGLSRDPSRARLHLPGASSTPALQSQDQSTLAPLMARTPSNQIAHELSMTYCGVDPLSRGAIAPYNPWSRDFTPNSLSQRGSGNSTPHGSGISTPINGGSFPAPPPASASNSPERFLNPSYDCRPSQPALSTSLFDAAMFDGGSVPSSAGAGPACGRLAGWEGGGACTLAYSAGGAYGVSGGNVTPPMSQSVYHSGGSLASCHQGASGREGEGGSEAHCGMNGSSAMCSGQLRAVGQLSDRDGRIGDADALRMPGEEEPLDELMLLLSASIQPERTSEPDRRGNVKAQSPRQLCSGLTHAVYLW